MKLERELARDGYSIVASVLTRERVASVVADLQRGLALVGASVLKSRGQMYGVRNLVVWPAALEVASEVAHGVPIGEMLGPGFGLVRSIFFDKPPGRSWSLPWHRDMTIAVRDVIGAEGGFARPTVKAGVPHVEAPESVLRRMVTARVALDAVTDDNGPLMVIPGTQDDACVEALPTAGEADSRAHTLLMSAGDVLVIRPLVVHRSGGSRKGTTRHRRTLHFEFAPEGLLPMGWEWNSFVPLDKNC